MSAEISGAITNRVRIQKRRKHLRVHHKPKQPKRYRLDRDARGKQTVIVTISMPRAELVALDAFAERVQMARSHLIRQAVKHFRAKVLG